MRRVWGKLLRWGIPIPDPTSIYEGIGTGMGMVLEAGMGTVKQSPASPCPVAIPTKYLCSSIFIVEWNSLKKFSEMPPGFEDHEPNSHAQLYFVPIITPMQEYKTAQKSSFGIRQNTPKMISYALWCKTTLTSKSLPGFKPLSLCCKWIMYGQLIPPHHICHTLGSQALST